MPDEIKPPEGGELKPVEGVKTEEKGGDATATAKLTAEAAATKTEVQNLKNMMAGLMYEKTPAPAGKAPPSAQEVRDAFYEKPVAHTDAIATRRAVEAVNAGLTPHMAALEGVARNSARARDPELFDKYEVEIAAMVTQNVDPQFRTNPNVWINAAHAVFGKNLEEITKSTGGKKVQGDKLDGAPSLKSSKAGVGVDANEPLTPEEKQFVKDFRITEEAYSAGKHAYNNQGSSKDPTAPSSWDDVATFDTEQRRSQARERERRKATAA